MYSAPSGPTASPRGWDRFAARRRLIVVVVGQRARAAGDRRDDGRQAQPLAAPAAAEVEDAANGVVGMVDVQGPAAESLDGAIPIAEHHALFRHKIAFLTSGGAAS